MAGYHNFSMSNNAVAAYDNGERPISKWGKADILDLCGEKADMLSVLTLNELRKHLLYNSSWHHTSKHYNKTEFYSFDDDALDNMTASAVSEIVALRKRKNDTSLKRIKAEITYTEWVGNYRNYRRPVDHVETVEFLSTDKMVATECGRKRIDCLKSVKVLSEDVL